MDGPPSGSARLIDGSHREAAKQTVIQQTATQQTAAKQDAPS
jgi:hypothetical protein